MPSEVNNPILDELKAPRFDVLRESFLIPVKVLL
jgi:hypothetical protein